MTSRELVKCLKDRPCDVCRFRDEHGCHRWTCVFEDEIEAEPMVTNKNLKPCPFCGDTVNIHYVSDEKAFTVWHDNENCIFVEPLWIYGDNIKSLSDAYDAWNKRKMTFNDKAEIVISQLRADRDRLLKAIGDIKAEIQETIDSTPYRYHDYEDGRIDAYEDCLELIDKHIRGKADE